MLPNKTSPTWLWAYESLNHHTLWCVKLKRDNGRNWQFLEGYVGPIVWWNRSWSHPLTTDWHIWSKWMEWNSHFETIGWMVGIYSFVSRPRSNPCAHWCFYFFVNESTRFTWTSSFSLYTFFSTFAYWWPAFIGVY